MPCKKTVSSVGQTGHTKDIYKQVQVIIPQGSHQSHHKAKMQSKQFDFV